MITKIFQIATFGTFRADNILTGLKVYPSQRLALICYEHDNSNAKRFLKVIRSIDENIEIIMCQTSRQNIIENVFGYFGRMVGSGSEINRYQRVLVNVSSGDKPLSYSVLCAAYIKGIETFMINSNNFSNRLAVIPTPKSYYDKIITKTNLRILNSIARAEGVVYGLDQLQRLSGLIKPLLSYHINGRDNTKGLIDLGLVSVENRKYEDGTIVIVRLTAIGKLFVTNRK
ncbi:MAG: hypothetical protein ACRD8Z_26925 [Nitrososphaeraceae archaeon]